MATTFTNQATLTYNGSTVRSNVAVGVMESSLTVSKNAVAEQYGAGDDITYVVSIVNNGDVSASGLTVNDDLGAYAFDGGTVQPLTYVDGSVQYYVNGALQAAPAVSTASGLSITGITVPTIRIEDGKLYFLSEDGNGGTTEKEYACAFEAGQLQGESDGISFCFDTLVDGNIVMSYFLPGEGEEVICVSLFMVHPAE